MNRFLRAIGFDSIKTEYEFQRLLDDLYQTYQTREAVKDDERNIAFVEMDKSYGPNIGIKLCGEMDANGFHPQFSYPYMMGSSVTSQEDVVVESRINGESYIALCEDGRVGISLIFHLLNPADYKKESLLSKLKNCHVSTTLSGLSLEGRILFPVKKEETDSTADSKINQENRSSIVAAAKNGNQEAIESLTLEDMDIYTMLARRILKEDVYSIVDTSFMPSGLESDLYQVIGNILFYTKVYNSYTKESLYQLSLECNGLVFDVCINQKDLLGDPEVGRRFKGVVWMQGKVDFQA